MIAVFALGAALPAAAQGFRVTGRVLVGGPPPVGQPLPGAWAVLHAVGPDGGAPVDSVQTDRAGGFALFVRAADTTAIYLVSTAHRGITYFGSAIVARGLSDTVETLVVYDTSSTEPVIMVSQRHLVVRSRESDGARRILDLVVLQNAGQQTRVTDESLRPTWVGALPPGVVQLDVGESDVSAQAVERRGDSLIVTAPIPPGEKQLVVTYLLPRGVRELVVPIDQPTGRFNVLLEDTAATLTRGAIEYRGIEVFEDAQFALFETIAPRPGTEIVFAFTRRVRAGQLWGVLVGVAAAAMLLALWLRARRAVALPAPDHPEALAHAIAVLDAAFETAPVAERDEAGYRAERARLRARLDRVLAVGEPPV